MKKILLLGGSAQQVVSIKTAKRLGYYTILCDYLTDNPGQYLADKFYLASTTDKDVILKIAKDEAIDGIVAYASDPAAPTAAYVAEHLGLLGNTYESVEILCNKDKFRNFLKNNGFNSPFSNAYNNLEAVFEDISKFSFPIIIKPVDSSGSKGVTVLNSIDNFNEAISYAFSFSRTHRIIIEEYIEKSHPYLIGGDVFVVDGKIIMWGLMNCHRDNKVNNLVPVGKSYPPEISENNLNSIKETIQSIVDKLNIKIGAMNVELIVDLNGKVWPIDMGPRNGGNMIPDLLGYIFNVDVVEMTIKAAMGELIKIDLNEPTSYYATHNLHTSSNGIYDCVCYSNDVKQFIIREDIYKKSGDLIEYFDNASKAIGIVFFKFNSYEQMKSVLNNINEHIRVKPIS